MRVLLINPPYSTEDRYGRDLGRFGPLNEPLGLAYLAASLEKGGHEVAIADAPALGLTSEAVCDRIEEGGYGLVGVTMLTPMYARSVEVVEAVKRRFPGLRVVAGGAHPTILPEETLRENQGIDFAVLGEGEITLLALADTLQQGGDIAKIPGLAYRRNGDIAVNPPSRPLENLDDLPIPARHLLPMEAYRMTRSRTQTGHAFTVSVARGCPFKCAFCCRIFGRKVRHHSPERIIEEISLLVEDYGAREVNLEADTLTLDKHFLRSLCDGLMDSGLSKKVAWTCESRVDTVNEDMLRRMKAAGCWQISYGVETGSQRLLDLIHKDITLEQIERTFALTKRIGITIRAFYMLGIPTETRQESLQTIEFARHLDAGWSQFTLFTPFPGAELYDRAVREGGLRSLRWADYKTHGGWTEGDLAYVPRGRTLEEMKGLQKQAYRRVYLRPRVFLRFLKTVKSPAQIKEYAAGLWVLLKTALPPRTRSSRAMRVQTEDLARFARGVYVDSPVYFSANALVRSLNWRKLDAALGLLDRDRNRRVLDFGCGNGVMLPALSGQFAAIVGVDLHTTAAARLKQAYGLKDVFLVAADGFKMPFQDAVFDEVLALSSLEHFRELDRALEEVGRVMKPGGLLVFLSPSENLFYRLGRRLFGYRRPQDHYHASHEIEALLRRSFAVEKVVHFPTNALPFLSVYRVGRFRKRDSG